MSQGGISGGHDGSGAPPPQGQAVPPPATPWGRPPRKPAQQPVPQQPPVVQPAPVSWADAPVPAEPATAQFPPAPTQVPAGPFPTTPAVGPVAPAPPSPGRGRAVLVGLLVGLLVVAGGGGVAWLLLGGDDPAGSSTAASSPAERSRPADATTADDTEGDDEGDATTAPRTSQPRESATSSAPRVDPEVQAATELERLRTQSLQGLVLDSRWVAQVASKAVGITDPLQTTASGSNTFMAVDILAESLAARKLANPTSVMTLQSTDFGKVSRWSNGQPFWVTLVDAGFTSSEQAQAWCDRTFASLTQAQRDNTCAPRTLSPPYN